MSAQTTLPENNARAAAMPLAVAPSHRSGVSQEFHDLIADVEDLIQQTTTLTGESLARARDKLGVRVAAAKIAIGDVGDDIATQARKGVRAGNQYAHEQPWQVIGAGAAIGLLLGFLLARRN